MMNNNEQQIIDDMLIYSDLPARSKLYHYTSAEGLKGICEGEFWITERHFLNDITEFQIATEIFNEVMDRHMENKSKCKNLNDAVIKEVHRLETPGFKENDIVAYYGEYVISFSLDWDSPLMWSEYSDFAGYCMAFDFEKLMKAFPKSSLPIMHGRVIYDHDEQIRLMEESIEREIINCKTSHGYIKSWSDFAILSDENIKNILWDIAPIVGRYNMFFKLPCFEGEHEYRIVFNGIHYGGRCKPEERVVQYFRPKDGVLIPYIKKPLADLSSLEKVMIGAKNQSDIAEKGLKYFFRNLKLNVDIEKSQMPLRY